MAIDTNEMMQKLQACAPYTEKPFPYKSLDLVAPTRSEEIRRYFRRNAKLNLDRIAVSRLSTWEKVRKISKFVSDHIPHDNQKEPMQELNAISEMAFRILGSGKAVTLTTEKTNLFMRAAAKAIGMKEL